MVLDNAGVEESHQARMLDPSERPDFLLEPAGQIRIVRANDLDRYGDTATLVGGLIDIGHAALAAESDESIAAVEYVSDGCHE